MTRAPSALAILILLTVFSFGGVCGVIVGVYVARPVDIEADGRR